MRILKLYLISIFFILSTTSLSANVSTKKNILMLHSYHGGMTWIENINKATHDILQPDKNNYIIYTEYMDTKRHNSKEYYSQLKMLYEQKYKNIKFDLILSSDNNAFDFLLKNRNAIFGEVPVSFCGVNGFDSSMLTNHTNYTGVAEQFSIKETVDFILKTDKKIKNIYIINDYLPTGLAWQKDIKEALKGYEKKVNLLYSKNLTLEQLKNKIDSFSEDTAILLGVYFADKNKQYITYEKVGTYLLDTSKSPVYCLLNFNISNNVIGGKVIGGYSQGEAMSKTALRILNGEPIEKIKITYSTANKFIFNYNGLNKYKIDESLLPPNSILINKPYSFYEEYTHILFNLILIFVSVLVFFIALLLYIKFIYKSKDNLQDRLIINTIRFSPLVILPIIIVAIVWLFIYTTNNNNQERKELEKASYIETMKQKAQREVNRFISIAQLNYTLSLNNPKELQKVKKHLLNIAQNIKYEKSGYLIVGDMQHYYVLAHPDKKLLNKDFSIDKNSKVYKILTSMKNKIQKDTKGFVSYTWYNPFTKKQESKLTYVNYLPELDWYVASGVYLDEINAHIEKKMADTSKLDTKNMNIIIIASVILFLLTIIISIILAKIIDTTFKRYRKNILEEENKAREIEISKKAFEELANTDTLTNVDSRRSIIDKLNKELLKAHPEHKLSIIMFDIDKFKHINDTYGHNVGDQVLIDVCSLIKQNIRKTDFIGRLGGEEFLIVLPKTDLESAKKIAESLRKTIEIFNFETIGNLTVSSGVTETNQVITDKEILQKVDTLLYNSKESGRNRVSF